MNAGCTPGGILPAHLADQIPNLFEWQRLINAGLRFSVGTIPMPEHPCEPFESVADPARNCHGNGTDEPFRRGRPTLQFTSLKPHPSWSSPEGKHGDETWPKFTYAK
jgi:hypothetical protein